MDPNLNANSFTRKICGENRDTKVHFAYILYAADDATCERSRSSTAQS